MNGQEKSFDNKGKRLGIFVIAYNAESHIEETVKRIPENIWQAVEIVYIIDDCSTDETVSKSLELKKLYPKLSVIRNPINRMYGGNQKFGYQFAIDQGLDAVVMLHADGQYAPEYLGKLFEPIVAGTADVVFGSRMSTKGGALKGGMPLYKYVSNIFISRVQNALAGMRLSEFHSGYRAFTTHFLKSIPLWENTNDWHFDAEILLQAGQFKARIAEVPIPTHYGDEVCRVPGIAYGINCILSAFKCYLFNRGILYSRIYDVNNKGIKYTEKFSDPYSSHSKIYNRLMKENLSGKRVLELGVGDSSLTKRMFEAGAVVDIVELDEALLERSKPFVRNARGMNLEQIESADFGEESYDIIVAADVLEHLRNAESVLPKLKKFLKKDGLLIVSLPNVVNLYVRLNVLLGRFPYHTKGILDNTHLRFFTLDSARKMLTKTGWKIRSEDLTPIPLGLVFPFLLRFPWKFFLALFYGMTRILKGLFAYQFIFYCQNPNHSKLL